MIGGLEHWEVFVAMHVPCSAAHQDLPYQHGPLVQELLFRHAFVFNEDPDKLDFIRDLDIPEAWISEAFAFYAKYKGHKEGQNSPSVS